MPCVSFTPWIAIFTTLIATVVGFMGGNAHIVEKSIPDSPTKAKAYVFYGPSVFLGVALLGLIGSAIWNSEETAKVTRMAIAVSACLIAFGLGWFGSHYPYMESDGTPLAVIVCLGLATLLQIGVVFLHKDGKYISKSIAFVTLLIGAFLVVAGGLGLWEIDLEETKKDQVEYMFKGFAGTAFAFGGINIIVGGIVLSVAS